MKDDAMLEIVEIKSGAYCISWAQTHSSLAHFISSDAQMIIIHVMRHVEQKDTYQLIQLVLQISHHHTHPSLLLLTSCQLSIALSYPSFERGKTVLKCRYLGVR